MEQEFWLTGKQTIIVGVIFFILLGIAGSMDYKEAKEIEAKNKTEISK